MLYSTIILPGGYFDSEGIRHRNARFRALTGADEEWAAQVPGSLSQASFVTQLLSRVVRSIGPVRADKNIVSDLFVADRELLLFKLIEASFGGQVEVTLTCPDRECQAPMTAEFDIGQAPLEPGVLAESYQLPETDVLFRLPRGKDQEEVAASDLPPQQAIDRLLAACVLHPTAATPDAPWWDALAREIERLSPRADFELEAACPSCGRISSNPLDPSSWFVDEISRRKADFERDIHLLGFYYHWPLSELLRLSCKRRTRWARLLSRELDGQSVGSYA